MRWAGPVNGDYADPTKWAGPVPEGGEYDPVIDAAGNGTRYYVNIPGGTPRTTGHLTVSAADAQLAVFGPLNAVRGVDLVSGSIALYYDARLEAPFVNVAAGGNLVFDGNNPVWLNVGTLRGTAHVRAPLQVERDLSLDNGTLQVERHGATFLNGSKLSGSGTVLFAPDSEGYLRAAAGAAPLEIGSGITVTSINSAFLNLGRVENAVNYGTFVSDAARRGNLSLTGTNHGTLRGATGGGLISFSGTNGAAGAITADGAGASSVTARPELSLQNVTNHGTITANRARVALRDGLTNTGTIRLTDTMLSLHGTFTTAAVAQVERVGGSVTVGGTLDNRDAVIDLDAFGPLDIGANATLRGGRVTGSDASGPRLTFFGGGATLQGVTLDVPVTLNSATGGAPRIRDGITVNREFTFDGQRSLYFVNSGTLAGSGRVNIVGGIEGGLLQAAGRTLTIAPGMTVRALGAGPNNVGSYYASDPAGHVSLVNRGHVVAAAGGSVTMNGKNWKNEGVITLEPGAMVNLGGTFDFADVGTVNRGAGSRVNFASEMNLGAGGTFDLSTSPVGPLDLGSSYFAGGRLVSPGRTVEVRKTDSRRDGLMVNGTTLALNLDLVGSGDLVAWQSDVTLDGATVRLRGGNVSGRAVVGTGEIVFDVPGAGYFGPKLQTGHVGPGVTVRTGASGGQLVHFGNFVNEGRIVAGTAGKTILAEYGVTNRGSLEARDGGVVALAGGGANYGTVRATDGGVIAVGNLRQQPFVNYATVVVEPTGYLDLAGTLTGAGIDLRGTVRLNNAGIGIGTLDLDTPVTFAPAGALAVTLRGGLNTSDRLDVLGEVRLDGTLRVGSEFDLPVVPHRSFEVLRFESREGQFDSIVNETGYAGLLFTAEYDADSLTLTTDALDGDANLDGRVDVKDLMIVRRHMRRSNRDWLSGDFDGNRRVNVLDMNVVRRNLGADLSDLARLTAGAASPSAGAVPEPAASATLLLASATLLRRRRSRRPGGDRAE